MERMTAPFTPVTGGDGVSKKNKTMRSVELFSLPLCGTEIDMN